MNIVQGRRKVWKSGGGARSNVVGTMCPPVEIGLTDLQKTGAYDSPDTTRRYDGRKLDSIGFRID